MDMDIYIHSLTPKCSLYTNRLVVVRTGRGRTQRQQAATNGGHARHKGAVAHEKRQRERYGNQGDDANHDTDNAAWKVNHQSIEWVCVCEGGGEEEEEEEGEEGEGEKEREIRYIDR